MPAGNTASRPKSFGSPTALPISAPSRVPVFQVRKAARLEAQYTARARSGSRWASAKATDWSIIR